MNYQNVFKRYELKYLINTEQYEAIRHKLSEHMVEDKYGKSTISNIYFDTPNDLLIRRSIEKPVYKEKLRLRSYGTAEKNGIAYVELKKKYDSVVYKRRIALLYDEAIDFLLNRKKIKDSQIVREINYFLDLYGDLKPAEVISYDREAMYERENSDLRITFDKNILCRDYDLSLKKGVYGESILEDGYTLMEIKTGTSIPLWLCDVLSKNAIYKTSFSKYGVAYTKKRRKENAR